MQITIRFQDNNDIEPIIIDGDWSLAEHLLQQYGDAHQFVPTLRRLIINRSGDTFISYIGTLAVGGTGAILYMTDIVEKNINRWQHYTIDDVDSNLSQYTMGEEYCYEEDWRDNSD